jgi:hypothetical protein
MKKKILLGSIAILGSVILSGCSGSSGTSQGTTPEKVDTVSNQSAEKKTEAKKTQIFKMGDSIKLGDYIINVTNIDNSYKAKNQYMQPKAGNKLVAIEVLYENNTTDKSLDYNPFDWKLFDSQGYNFESGFTEDKDPRLSSGTLNPGGKVRGWITFEVPTDSKDFKMQFAPSFLSNDNVEVQLY